MEPQQATAAPDRFVRLLKRAMAEQGLSLRQLAEKAGISPAYLSRLINKERGLPADPVIAGLEEVLEIEPRGRLFDAAKRHDEVMSRMMRKENARPLMRTLAPLSEEQLAQVLKLAKSLAQKKEGAE